MLRRLIALSFYTETLETHQDISETHKGFKVVTVTAWAVVSVIVNDAVRWADRRFGEYKTVVKNTVDNFKTHVGLMMLGSLNINMKIYTLT